MTENYNDTNKADNQPKLKEDCFCFHSRPGLHHQSTTLVTLCPHCKHIGPTDVEAAWSIKNYLFCYYYGCYWWCFQTLNGKDYTLKDAIHRCSSCKAVISEYEAC